MWLCFLYCTGFPSDIRIDGNPDVYRFSRTLQNNITFRGEGVRPYEYCPLGIFDHYYKYFCKDHRIDFSSAFHVDMIVKAPRHKAIPLIAYRGLLLYDWIDVAIETKQLSDLDNSAFENRYLSEVISGLPRGYQIHKLMKLPTSLDPVLLIRAHKIDDDDENIEDVHFRMNIKTRYWPLGRGFESLIKRFHHIKSGLTIHAGAMNYLTTLKLNSYAKDHIISLPGEYESVEFEFGWSKSVSLPKSILIQSIWLQDVYNSFKNFHHKSPNLCKNNNFTDIFLFDYCLTLNVSNQKSYLFFRKYFETVDSRKWDKSWNRAFQLCESVGGHLPVFNRRDDLDEVLAIFKTVRYMPVVPAIYIGLAFNEKREVS